MGGGRTRDTVGAMQMRTRIGTGKAEWIFVWRIEGLLPPLMQVQQSALQEDGRFFGGGSTSWSKKPGHQDGPAASTYLFFIFLFLQASVSNQRKIREAGEREKEVDLHDDGGRGRRRREEVGGWWLMEDDKSGPGKERSRKQRATRVVGVFCKKARWE